MSNTNLSKLLSNLRNTIVQQTGNRQNNEIANVKTEKQNDSLFDFSANDNKNNTDSFISSSGNNNNNKFTDNSDSKPSVSVKDENKTSNTNLSKLLSNLRNIIVQQTGNKQNNESSNIANENSNNTDSIFNPTPQTGNAGNENISDNTNIFYNPVSSTDESSNISNNNLLEETQNTAVSQENQINQETQETQGEQGIQNLQDTSQIQETSEPQNITEPPLVESSSAIDSEKLKQVWNLLGNLGYNINYNIRYWLVSGNEPVGWDPSLTGSKYGSNDWYILLDIEKEHENLMKKITDLVGAENASQYEPIYIEHYLDIPGDLIVSEVILETSGNISKNISKVDKNGNEVKMTETPAYIDAKGVFHPAQIIEEGLNDYNNPYTINKTQNEDGTWSGHREVFDKENGYKRYESEIIYDANGNKLKENYKIYNQDGLEFQTGNIEYYSNGNMKYKEYEHYDTTTDRKSAVKIEYYENGNEKKSSEIMEYSPTSSLIFEDFESGEFEHDIKQGIFNKEYYEDGKLKTYNSKFTDLYDGTIKTTSQTYDRNGLLTNEVVSNYAKIETLDWPMHSGGLTKNRIPQYSNGELTGYIISSSVIGTNETLGTYQADASGNWVSNISTEDCDDGRIGYFDQNYIGTCQLLSTLKILSNHGVNFNDGPEGTGTLKWHDDGSVTVKLYEVDGFSTATDRIKEYQISAQDLTHNVFVDDKGKQVQGATGDRTAVAIERAFVMQMLEKNGNKDISDSATTSHNISDSALSASAETAIAALFGKNGESAYSPKIYTWNTNVDMNDVDAVGFNPSINVDLKIVDFDIPLVTSSHLNEYLVKENGDYYIQDTNGNYIKLYYPHQYTVENYDSEKNTVTLTNPHNYASFEVNADAVKNCFQLIDLQGLNRD